MAIRIGISGWRYGPWRGKFYPPDLAQRQELEYASSMFPSIEIDGSFYSLQSPASWSQWQRNTPDNFQFAVKAPRLLTHVRRLRDIDKPLANFFASGLLQLGAKLGPLLWELPPNMHYDHARLEEFFKGLPRDSDQALELARHRETSRMKGRTALPLLPRHPIRHALEVRHDSFADRSFIALLRRHNIALVFADTAGQYPYAEDVTADFLYLRLHGGTDLYAGGYSPDALSWWASRITQWSQGGEPGDASKFCTLRPRKRARRDIYCYFDNDAEVRAPFDALALSERVRALIGPGKRRRSPPGRPEAGVHSPPPA